MLPYASTKNYDEKLIESIITFLSDSLKTSTNPKPVLLHSLRVASILIENNADQDVVVAALLHDVLEDTDKTKLDIKSITNQKIADIVESLTIPDKQKNYDEKLKDCINSFNQSRLVGFDALSIRAADLIDNSFYYERTNNQELINYLYKKYTKFLEISEPLLKDTKYYEQLKKCYETNVKSLQLSYNIN